MSGGLQLISGRYILQKMSEISDKQFKAILLIIVGAIIAALAGPTEKVFETSSVFGYLAILLAAVNIFGGFLVTQRMLQMYKKKKK